LIIQKATGSRSVLTIVFVAAAALLAAFFAIRSAVVQAFVERRPEIGEAVWADHPQVIVQTALTDIGRSAAAGRSPDSETLEHMRGVLLKAPMAAEPFLIEGTRTLSAGERRRAERLLAEAVARDPRLPAARFLLADLYLQQGRTREGLRQIGALILRLPRAGGPLAPSLAEFAKQPGAAPEVRAILARNPALRGNVLSILAADPDNAALVLALAGEEPRSSVTQDWQARLISALLDRGDYQRAYRLWAQFAGVQIDAEPGLFDPGFEQVSAPPPFSWLLAKGHGGVAEPTPGRGLRVLYYGREDIALAAQVLMLKPGSYRLRYDATGSDVATGLSWTVSCLRQGGAIASREVGTGNLVFTVPPVHCGAQELQLRGSAREMPSTTEVTIRNVALSSESR
jgi:tetratricopeptide (TPR) repeat protein